MRKKTLCLLIIWMALPPFGRATVFTVSNNSGGTSSSSLGAALSGSSADTSGSDSIAFGSSFASPQTIIETVSYAAIAKSLGTSLTLAPSALLTVNAGTFTPFSFSGGGTFSLSNLSIQGTGNGIVLGTGAILSLNTVTLADGLSIAGNYISVATGQTSTISGVVSGSNGINQNGAGTLVLSGTNSYSGGTAITGGGAISVSNNSNLGSTTGNISITNSTLQTTAGITTSRQVNLSGTGIITVDAGQTSSFSGTISGSGSLSSTGAGTLVLSGNNTYTGETSISGGGILSSTTSSSLGSGALSLNNGTFQTSASSTISSLSLGSNGGTLSVSTGQTVTLNGPVSGSGSLTTTGAGTVSLNSASGSYSGGTLVTGGSTLIVFSDQSLGSGGVTLANGTLYPSGSMSSRALVLGTGGGTLATMGTGYVGNISGVISGSGGLTVAGGGTIQLTSAGNTYTGGTTVSGGSTLQVSADASFGDSSSGVTLNNGVLLVNPAFLSSFSSARTLTLGTGGGTINDTGNFQPVIFSGKITGAGGLTLSGPDIGAVALSSTSNDYSGGTTLSNGGNLSLQNGTTGSATGSGALSVSSNSVIGGAGTSNSSSFSILGNVIVGTGTDVTSQTTLTATGASNFTGAKLTFELGVGANQGQSNELNLNSTPLTFNATTLTLNLLGSGTIQSNTSYTLLTTAGTIDPTTYGLTLGSNGQIIGGLSITSDANFGSSGTYSGSYLFLDGSNIDLEVVPEPNAGMMLLLGLALLTGLKFAPFRLLARRQRP